MEGSYAPQSPDLSGYHSYSPEPGGYPAAAGSGAGPPVYAPPIPSYAPPAGAYDPPAPTHPRIQQQQQQKQQTPTPPPPPPARRIGEGFDVRTKFPVARIKRIMQADEDVGKVAQVTPVAVSKALELFMIELVSKAAAEARTKSSKRVTAGHLKAAVQQEEQFDFLAEIIAKVPDAPQAKQQQSNDDEADDSMDAPAEKAPTRRRKRGSEANAGGGPSGGTRRRRRSSNDD